MTKDTKFFERRVPKTWFTCKQHEDVLSALQNTTALSLNKVKLLPRPLGMINGGFDILTSGHLRLIGEARHRCATLVALLDSDAKLRRTKGKLRPIMSWPQRATSLYYCGADAVFEVDNDFEFVTIVGAIDPDFRVLGVEYKGHPSRFPGIPTIYVRDSGIHTTDIVTKLIEKIKNEEQNDDLPGKT